MSIQFRASQLLKEAAQLLESTSATASSSSSNTSVSTTNTVSHSAQLRAATRSLFAPYSTTRGRSRGIPSIPRVIFWSHRFCALASCAQDHVPTREDKQNLLQSGLGEQKITFVKSADPMDFKIKIEEKFPKLKDIGGYELLRSGISSRFKLEPIQIPPGGYTTEHLADCSMLGQALCFLRPIQRDLSLEDSPMEVPSDDNTEECITCGKAIPLRCLRDHVVVCGERSAPCSITRGNNSVQVPVCQFACATPLPASETKTDINMENPNPPESQCPLCGLKFRADVLEVHAASCGESCVSIEKSLDETFQDISMTLEKESWTIDVVRRQFVRTAIEQLEESSTEDWQRQLKVKFVGEEGIDIGGLTREFFSLLFTNEELFEHNGFHFDSQMMRKRIYFLLGKASAMALLSGHPGPQCFHKYIAEYICTGQIPNMGDITEKDIGRADVVSVIEKLKTCDNTKFGEFNAEDMLEASGFRKVLTDRNRTEAINALLEHFAFYRHLGPLTQYIEGLQLHGVLKAIRQQAVLKDTIKLFLQGKFPSAEEMGEFFRATFSENESEKALEEIIVYNMKKFFKKVERGSITTQWISEENGDEQTILIHMGHVCKAFTGSMNLPRSIPCGIIEFDHTSHKLSNVNTCAPSIKCSKTKDLEDYEQVEVHMLYIIVGAPDFGIE